MADESVVERLAKRSAEDQYPKLDCPYEKYPTAYKNNARWWMNAIADELDENEPELARWLRTQARNDDG